MAIGRSIARNSAFLAAAHGSSKVFSIALTAVAARVLGPVGFGLYGTGAALVEGAARDGQQAPDALAFYKPYIDVVWDAFGDDRVIYGSNWPVSQRAADYHKLQRIVMEYALQKGDEATAKFCADNAQRAYKWIERPGRRG